MTLLNLVVQPSRTGSCKTGEMSRTIDAKAHDLGSGGGLPFDSGRSCLKFTSLGHKVQVEFTSM